MGRQRLKTAWRVGAATAGYLLLTLLLAWRGGTWDGSWSTEPDEAAHLLNGVLVWDYARSGWPEHPMRYAERYYEHYPKIGLGHWPPLFALVEAAWFALTGPGYGMALVLVNLLAAGVAVQIWWWGRRLLPEWLALGAGAVWLLLPLVRQYSQMFMAEMLLTFCVTAAVMAFARRSMGFGFWSAMALLTKGTAIALAALPGMAMLLGGRWEWLRQRWLWGSALLVIGLTAGWYGTVPGARHERVAPYGGIAFQPDRLLETLKVLAENLGPLLCALAVAGLVLAWRRRSDPYWLAVLAFLPGNLVLRMVVGAWEGRHLVMVLPEGLLLAALGLDWCWRRVGPVPLKALLLVVVMAGTGWHLVERRPQRESIGGLGEVAAALQSSRRIVVAGRAAVEGAVIGSIALGEERPGRVVRRGSKMLWESDFLGRSQRALVGSAGEAGAVMEAERIGGVVLDREERQPAVGVVREYLRGSADWREVGVFGGRRLEVWVRK